MSAKEQASRVYCSEGYIKEIYVSGTDVRFTLEPIAPYVFERKKKDGGLAKDILFVNEDIDDSCKNNSSKTARIIDAKFKFKTIAPVCFHSLILAKTNRMKMQITVDMNNGEIIILTITAL